jgi:hypothetical protein
MGENIIRRVMTRLLFELQPALWHHQTPSLETTQKNGAYPTLDAIILQPAGTAQSGKNTTMTALGQIGTQSVGN